MTQAHTEAFETIGLVPSITLIVSAFLVAILPVVVQVGVLAL